MFTSATLHFKTSLHGCSILIIDKEAEKTGIISMKLCIFLIEETRQRDWDGIVTCHQGISEARTWSFQNKCIGKLVLKPKKEMKGTVAQVG